jgi:DNA-binding NtrC family response regulator
MQPTKSAEVLKVLYISPLQDDHSSLQSIVAHSTWTLFKAERIETALAVCEKHIIPVVLCERDLMPGAWTDVMERLHERPNPPSLIVTSRLADEHLWAKALNLGAWDVLAKPFDRTEVLRSVKSAWQHWQHQRSLKSGG